MVCGRGGEWGDSQSLNWLVAKVEEDGNPNHVVRQSEIIYVSSFCLHNCYLTHAVVCWKHRQPSASTSLIFEQPPRLTLHLPGQQDPWRHDPCRLGNGLSSVMATTNSCPSRPHLLITPRAILLPSTSEEDAVPEQELHRGKTIRVV